MTKYYFSAIFLIYSGFFQILNAQLVLPTNDSVLNYIHVLFEWNQYPEADSYNLEISTDSLFDSVIRTATVSSLIFIEEEIINWDSKYYWRIRPIFESSLTSEWSETYHFFTGQKRSESTVNIYDENNVSPGLRIFGSFYNYFSAMIDINGKEEWNTGDKKIVYYNSSPALDLLGCISDNSLEHNLPGIDFSIDNDFIWEEPNDQFLHHDLVKLPNGNYMGIVSTSQLGPIPIGPWTSDSKVLVLLQMVYQLNSLGLVTNLLSGIKILKKLFGVGMYLTIYPWKILMLLEGRGYLVLLVIKSMIGRTLTQ